MTRTELAKKIYEIAYLQGDFTLRSGLKSNEYFDKYRFEANPILLAAIADQLAPLISPQTEVLAGLELGGVPIATALSLKTGLPCVFVRKEAKSYGTCQVTEGLNVNNKKLCIIEDVITTGGQVELSRRDLQKLGAQIIQVLCVIHRGDQKSLKFKIPMKSLFTMEELKSSHTQAAR